MRKFLTFAACVAAAAVFMAVIAVIVSLVFAFDATKRMESEAVTEEIVTVESSAEENRTVSTSSAEELSPYKAFTSKNNEVENNQEEEESMISIKKTEEKGRRAITFTPEGDTISSLRFAVWSQSSQSDLVWYEAKKNDAGEWAAEFSIENHLHLGTYQVHAYAEEEYLEKNTFRIDYDEVKNEYTEIAAGLKAGEETDQLILVKADGVTATLSMLNKEKSGDWIEILNTPAMLGANGVGETTEWSWTTPPGVYDFGVAFGICEDPGTVFPYTQVDESHYWVDDVDSEYYNQFVSTNEIPVSWNSAEHLIEHDPSYHYSLSINYNMDCTPGVGSAIFLHCWRGEGETTLGCVAVAEEEMKYILQNVTLDCKIVIENGDELRKY